ncbi:MAG: DUF4838 domain-containing protein [Kiritimatiellia bacterium]|nr:DUF4838 domain-containing protein [Lentisphaerota bacterium]
MQRSIMLCGMLAVLTQLVGGVVRADEALLVQQGQPRAQIVIAENPPRMVDLAARELQAYMAKISGAELPIVTTPGSDYPLKIYVGKSAGTEKLGLADDDLKYGAYRIVPGPDYLVLLGQDADFVPPEPYAHDRSDTERAQREWEELTGATWRNPIVGLYRAYDKDTGFWQQDEGGSLNAVYGFLYDLGVRWYMPGDLGEVVPEMTDVPMPAGAKTVHPDYRVRLWLGTGTAPWDDMIWERRIGMNAYHETLGVGGLTHGMAAVHHSAAMQEAHPEYYALYGGQRDNVTRGTGHACFSSDGLLQEAVNYVRAVYDIFGSPCIQLSPQDGIRQCQCEQCLQYASTSDYVFGFFDRVAREVYKTHPDRIILGAAYSSYQQPPSNVEKFSPNVAMSLNNRGRPRFGHEEYWQKYWESVQGWREKLAPGRILRVENHIYSGSGGKARGQPVRNPVIAPRAFARDLKAMQGISMGERNEVSRGGGRSFRSPAVDHLNYYVNARYLWDADQDIEVLLDEYYRLFFGPAGEAMRQANDFLESELSQPGARSTSIEARVRYVQMVQAARAVAGESVYGQRVDRMLNELASLEEFQRMQQEEQAAAAARLTGPVAVAADLAQGQEAQVYEMRNLHTGEEPDMRTTFTVAWDADGVIFDFVCYDPDMENLCVSKDVWGGDSVAILLESPFHAYYQIEINPDGDVFDADREYGRMNQTWTAQAVVETERGPDFWRVKVRLPVADEAAGEGDPMNFVVGNKPTADAPWFFNVGRVRVRDFAKTAYAFSPTGGGYHVPLKFARLIANEGAE